MSLGISTLVALAQNPADRAVVASIREIRANPSSYDGKRVRLHGRIKDCRPLSCRLEEPGPKRLAGQYLSIESNREFDLQVTSELPVDIIIHATVDATCLGDNVCMDRAPDLTRIALERMTSVQPLAPVKED